MLNPAWLTALAALATVVGGLIIWLARHLWRVLRRITRFLDDFFGEPAREGLPAKPGVMARLSTAEETLNKVAAEMQANHGTSIRDVVHRTAADVDQLKQGYEDISRQIDTLRHSVDRRNRS